MRRAILALALLAAACTAPESANPAARCSTDSDCATAEHCYRWFCVLDDAQEDAGVTRDDCDSDRTACGDKCVDTRTDEKHCGACGQQCDDDDECVEGLCEEKD